jgi:Ca2+-binding RTX toxin-like protein
MGLDSTLSFTVSAAGNYTLALSAVGALKGAYAVTATLAGAAMEKADTYVVNSASTLVLEGIGGIGQDVVKTSLSYALAAGSEVEVLGTTSDKGKGALNLTGNEFAQTIVGNNGANVLEGKGGADTLYGGNGGDTFVLSKDAVTSPGAANIDRIMDYGSGDIVDLTQILNLAAGTNAISDGYLRVTTSGLIQVDLDGGANGWATLSSINGTGAVTLRYLSGGAATSVSANRVADGAALQSMLSAEDTGMGHGREMVGHHAVFSADLFGLY